MTDDELISKLKAAAAASIEAERPGIQRVAKHLHPGIRVQIHGHLQDGSVLLLAGARETASGAWGRGYVPSASPPGAPHHPSLPPASTPTSDIGVCRVEAVKVKPSAPPSCPPMCRRPPARISYR
jgi:hypothetical protein